MFSINAERTCGLQTFYLSIRIQINELFQEWENINAIDHHPIADALISAIQREVDHDQTCKKLKTLIADGWPENNKKVDADVKPFWKYRQLIYHIHK